MRAGVYLTRVLSPRLSSSVLFVVPLVIALVDAPQSARWSLTPFISSINSSRSLAVVADRLVSFLRLFCQTLADDAFAILMTLEGLKSVIAGAGS